MRENWLNMTFDSTMGNAEGKLSHLTWHLAVQLGIQRANCYTWHDIWQYNGEYRGQIATLDMTLGSTTGNTEGKLPHLTWHLAVQWGIQRANCHIWHDIWQYNGEYKGQIVTLDNMLSLYYYLITRTDMIQCLNIMDWLIDLLCLIPLSAIFQLYHGDQF
jgi:hypothetical protein